MFALYQKLQAEVLRALNAVARPPVVSVDCTSIPRGWAATASDGYIAYIYGRDASVFMRPNGQITVEPHEPIDLIELEDLVAYANACEAAVMMLDDVVVVTRRDLDDALRGDISPEVRQRLVEAVDNG